MKKFYKLPIQGTVLAKEPLTGAKDDALCVIPLNELEPKVEITDPETLKTRPVAEFGGCRYICWNYNIDEEWCEVELEASEEFHNWLDGMLPQLRGIQKAKGWKLDKSKLVEKLDKE